MLDLEKIKDFGQELMILPVTKLEFGLRQSLDKDFEKNLILVYKLQHEYFGLDRASTFYKFVSTKNEPKRDIF